MRGNGTLASGDDPCRHLAAFQLIDEFINRGMIAPIRRPPSTPSPIAHVALSEADDAADITRRRAPVSVICTSLLFTDLFVFPISLFRPRLPACLPYVPCVALFV